MSTERATELTWKILQVLHPQFEVGEEENEYLAKPDFDLILPIVQAAIYNAVQEEIELQIVHANRRVAAEREQAYAEGERAMQERAANVKVGTPEYPDGLFMGAAYRDAIRALPVEAAPAPPKSGEQAK